MKFLVLFLILLATMAWNPPSFAQPAPSKSGKIYLKDIQIVERFQTFNKLIEKNAYDIIYETGKFQLHLTDQKAQQSAFIKNYERLTIDLENDQVKVTLSEKEVVYREFEGLDSPILDLRLALYELFFGKDYVKKNKDNLIKKSQARMKQLQRVADKQAAIEKENNPASAPETSMDADKKADKKNEGDIPATKSAVASAPLQTAPKPTPKLEAKKVPTPNTENSGAEKAPSTQVQATAAPQAPKLSSKENKTKIPKPINIKDAVRKSYKRMVLSYTFSKGENEELINANSIVNSFGLGLRWFSKVLKESPDSFFKNLDFEARFLLKKPAPNEDYTFPLGKQLELYAGAPILSGGVSFGLMGGHDNTSFVTLKGTNLGLFLVNVDNFYLGPEMKFLFRRQSFNLQGYLSYGVGVLSKGSLEGEYKTNKLMGEVDIFTRKNIGFGFKYESFDMSYSRLVSSGTVKITNLNFLVFYQF